MKKISWFSRIFMSWNSLEARFSLGFEKEKSELQVQIANLNGQLETERKITQERKSYIDNLLAQSDEKVAQIEQLRNEIVKISSENITLKEIKDSLQFEGISKSEDVRKRDSEILRLKEVIAQRKHELDNWRAQLDQKLAPLAEINDKFFAKAANKGIGELGEMQVETMLLKFGIENSFWIKNLKVGSDYVEFAIKADETKNKWIPIDSKVIQSSITENGEAVIDDEYSKRVLEQVAKMAKYLGKSNTTEYGVLVLQNDQVAIKLFEQFPDLFMRSIKDYKIYITSPFSFLQFAWSIWVILEMQHKIKNEQKIYDQIIDALNSVHKMGDNLFKAHSHLNIAMTTHYPTIQKRHNGLIKELEKEGTGKNKLSQLKPLKITHGENIVDEFSDLAESEDPSDTKLISN